MSKVTVKFLMQTVADKQSVKVDQVMDLEESEARFLVKSRRAVYHSEEVEAAPAEEKAEEVGSPLVETEIKAPKKSKKLT